MYAKDMAKSSAYYIMYDIVFLVYSSRLYAWYGCWCDCCCLCRYCFCWARILFRHSTIAQTCYPNKFIFLTHLYDSRQFTSNIHSCLSRTSFQFNSVCMFGLMLRLLPFIVVYSQHGRKIGEMSAICHFHGINFQFRSSVLVSSAEWYIKGGLSNGPLYCIGKQSIYNRELSYQITIVPTLTRYK